MPYRFQFTTSIVRNLQVIESARERLRHVVLPPALAEQLRTQAQLRATHYSTRIEGNRLTLKETEQVIQQGKLFPGRERDVKEVERYYLALQQMEKWVEKGQGITEERLRKLHAQIMKGGRARPSAYRDGQNVIRETDGQIVYLPPEAKDVPKLIKELLDWINNSVKEVPVPVVAGIAHYQFETIHPFYDGNGRTGRLLTTWILYLGGYDLGKFYSLEEFYAQDLDGYYQALVTHPNHNYYEGRNKADITPWLEYFLKGMAGVFEKVAGVILTQASGKVTAEQRFLHDLDHRARRVLGLFAQQDLIQSSQVARLLGVSDRQARVLMSTWVNDGWLDVADPSRKARKYRLAKKYKGLLE
ncbi:MAG: Fic family protein [Anaerolineales bacterium]|nr:Fic family protein [Anaerolineales bacterium]